MPKTNPCNDCAHGPGCSTCFANPEIARPIKLYTPKGAARAMLVGAVLKDSKEWTYWWNGSAFCCKGRENKQTHPVYDFSNLFSEEA